MAFSHLNLIFDLDGTLTDPQLGITRCMVYALERLGFAAPDRASLRQYIGPPLRAAFAELLGTSDAGLIERAVAVYRERFGAIGLYENEPYPQTLASLERLAAAGHRLYVATAKAEVYARRILEHFGLSRHFVEVYGAALSGEGSEKSELLARVVVEQRLEPGRSVMFGDRAGDVTGARANGMLGVGVLWGFGTVQELESADRLVSSWRELLCLVQEVSPSATRGSAASD
jgi:phosphoglycolate phosphatase